MTKYLKAALLSALVFPGIGHFSLKKPLQGSILAGTAIVCLYFLLNAVVDTAQELSVKIQSGEVPLDAAKISELLSQQLAGSDGQLVNIASLLLIICWTVSIIDSFRIGWSQEKKGDAIS
ncbi:hypothetical protein SAMN04488490_3285 [Marinobacter sp. LV10R510-11A]|uniref:hypothetical protein n=1 Tax=Marinobacter sp. LV10R510-11A TaxID=1415568 RepID=UPI000BB7BC1A|nr:hypothetical protein [Marinobacter sp. LV10R510-11A]SOB77466.1 hypothetical protein SAMN04488490_3285 [Marinobacter sp. LV10R510-11A]